MGSVIATAVPRSDDYANTTTFDAETIVKLARLLRFRLRTLLIITIAVACVFGYYIHTVRTRHAARVAAEAEGWQFVTADEYLARYGGVTGPAVDTPASVPLIRAWLGDKPIHEVLHPYNTSEVEQQRRTNIKRLFPEAKEENIHEFHYEPCHPGCFPAGSIVQTPDRPQAIETLAEGDLVTSVDRDGNVTTADVDAVFKTDNRLWQIETDHSTLVTTETQPLALADGRTVGGGEIEAGDELLVWHDGRSEPTKVIAVTKTDRVEPVFNVVLGDDALFVVNGYIARSKPAK